MGLSCFKSWKHDSTGHKGNRDVLASPGSYFFLSNSAGQGDEWLKTLNKGVWIPFTGVFGQSLEETVLYERRYGSGLVPLVVEQCVTFIRQRGMSEVGLFRHPGRASLVRELQEAFDAGERPSFDSATDIHTVASLLKLYLRQLPEPLVPYSRYQDFLLCGQMLSNNRTLGLGELRNLLHELPVANFNLLNFICQFLNEVQSFSSSNKMSGQNLATVFGPNILRAKAEDPQSIMGGAGLVQVLMLELIREHGSLFSNVSPTTTTLRPPHLHPTASLRQLSLPLITERCGEPGPAADPQNHCWIPSAAQSAYGQQRRLGHRHTSSHPDNCFFPFQRNNTEHGAPAATSLLEDNPTPRLMLLGRSKAWPGPREEGAAEVQGAMPEAASGGSSEAQEDSTLSAYDNLDSTSQCQRMEDVDGHCFETDGLIGPTFCEEAEQEEEGQRRDSSSSWSSCEVLPLDDALGSVSPDKLPKSLKDKHEHSQHDEEDDNNGHLHHPNSPASCSGRGDSPLSTGSSEVFLPSGPPDLQGPEPQLQPSDAHSLWAELQQQVTQQRTEYQARIQRLERCNHILKRQVAVLRISLEKQKRSQSVAEIKIRNMERAKAAADLRNTSLQREMEVFLQMYGEFRRRDDGGRGGSL